MRKMMIRAALAALPLVVPAAALAGTIVDPVVERVAPDKLTIRWNDTDAVDVLQADRPDAVVAGATLVSARAKDGVQEVQVAPGTRPYFLLRDSKSGAVTRVAERVLVMEQSSNFRDLGGYPAVPAASMSAGARSTARAARRC
ncbi:hypothetical protein ACFSUK_15780 [Sphingobium scionense]